MKCLIVEDDFVSRAVIQKMLQPIAETHVAVDGAEAISAYRHSIEEGEPYDFICLDIGLPGMSGQDALKEMRQIEEDEGILLGDGAKIFMTTAANEFDKIKQSFRDNCDAYLIKPIQRAQMAEQLVKFGLLEPTASL